MVELPHRPANEFIPLGEFYYAWSLIEQWEHEIPEFHWEIIEFLENYKEWDNDSGVIQMWRGAGKTTIASVFQVWLMRNNPQISIGLFSCDNDKAISMTRQVRNVLLRHPWADHLYDDNLWRDNMFSVLGHTDAQNPSMKARGILTTVTSGRFDWLIFDDIESSTNCQTDGKRAKIWEGVVEANNTLKPGGRRLDIGTPHTDRTVHEKFVKQGSQSISFPYFIEGSEEKEYPFMTGESRWNERFPIEWILQRQLQGDDEDRPSKGNFLSQYLLIATSSQDHQLDAEMFIQYTDEIQIVYGRRGELMIFIGDKKMTGVASFWDPSLAKVGGDSSVYSIVFQDADGHYYIHRTEDIIGDAEEQCEMVRDYALDFQVQCIGIETNGVGGYLPQLLIKACDDAMIGIDEVYSTRQKGLKIIEAMQTPLYARILHIHKSVRNSPFWGQVLDFNPKNKNVPDDYLDSVAMAIMQQPVLLNFHGEAAGRTATNWTHNTNQRAEVNSVNF